MREDGDKNFTCCNETLKEGRMCRECTNQACHSMREICHEQNATGEVEPICKHCLVAAARIVNSTMRNKQASRPRQHPYGAPAESGYGARGKGKGPGGRPKPWTPEYGRHMAQAEAKQRALEAKRGKGGYGPHGKGGPASPQKPGVGKPPFDAARGKGKGRPYHPPKKGGKRGPPIKQKKDL